MHPHAQTTAELRSTLRELLAHEVDNPDEDPHLSGVLFFCATDERTRQLIERIELLAARCSSTPTAAPSPTACVRWRLTASVSGKSTKRRRMRR